MINSKLSRKFFYMSSNEGILGDRLNLTEDIDNIAESQRASWPFIIHRNNSLSVNIRMLEIKKTIFSSFTKYLYFNFQRKKFVENLLARICDRGPYVSSFSLAFLFSPSLLIDLPSNPILLHCLVHFLFLCILVFYQQCYRFLSLSMRSI